MSYVAVVFFSILFFSGFSRPPGMFEKINSLKLHYESDPSFRTRCNQTTRNLGRESYRHHRPVRKILASLDVSICNYGFLVGYMEAMGEGRGGREQAMRTCRFLKRKGKEAHAYLECLKGIGTGTQSTDVCKRIAGNEDELNICVVGVMNKRAEEGMEDCTQVDPAFRPQCYGAVSGRLIWSGAETFENALAKAQTIPDREGQIRAVRIIAKIAMNKVGDGERLLSGCRSLPDHLSTQCFLFLVQGAMELGTPGEEEEDGFALCRQEFLIESEEKLCVQFVLYQVQEVLGGSRQVQSICQAMERQWRPLCHDYQRDYLSL